MCLAVPAQIKIINGNLADVDIMGIDKKVDIQLIENPKIDDYVLIHAGFGIQKIDKEYFDYLENIFKSEIDSGENI
ncbi:hydrogenase expression/formation protein HypC [Clostridium algifaecis]|uniref:Hydrogenase expression/formation protein HypC n=1 Tax=Clostridium algifaecis TaxID=1472040 RepID=A0ABS4KQ42_9CLOT|nr:HypC/HybG/HupF family hydrogenase formation chaperone [Clostridium algifaecis]MBP2031700.1 hydrogenase expression/formation protein HypC [Clostridium algifaecis]